MKRTARILTCIFTVVSLFGSVLTAEAATVKSAKKAKYYKTASTKKKAGTFKKATKLTAQSMSKGFVKFKQGKKTYFIKATDVKISGKFTAKVAKKTKAYSTKFKATKTTLKKGKKLTISALKVKKKVAYLKYSAKNYVKATDVKVSTFKFGNGPVSPDETPYVSPTPEPTATPTPTPAPTLPPVELGDNIIPAEKASFDFWDAATYDASTHEGLSAGDLNVGPGFGSYAEGDPRGADNKTFKLGEGSGAGYGHFYFSSAYSSELKRGTVYRISFDYYCPFDNDFRLTGIKNGEYEKDADGNFVLDAEGNKVEKNFLPLPEGETGMDLTATAEWQTFTCDVPFQSMIMIQFGMWNGDTTTGVFIDNLSIRPHLASTPTDAPVVTPTDAPSGDGISGDAVTAFDALENTVFKTRISSTVRKLTSGDVHNGTVEDEYIVVDDSSYNHSLFNGNAFSSTFTPGKTYKVTALVRVGYDCPVPVAVSAYHVSGEDRVNEVVFSTAENYGTEEWQLIEFTGTIPADAKELIITYMGTWGGNPSYDFAGIAIQEV